MGKNQQAPDFGYGTAFLEDEERACIVDVMERRGAKRSGCLLCEAPFWVLLMLAVVVGWVIYSASQSAPPSTVAPMFLFGCLIPVGVEVARRWVGRVYYRRPVVIGG